MQRRVVDDEEICGRLGRSVGEPDVRVRRRRERVGFHERHFNAIDRRGALSFDRVEHARRRAPGHAQCLAGPQHERGEAERVHALAARLRVHVRKMHARAMRRDRRELDARGLTVGG